MNKNRYKRVFIPRAQGAMKVVGRFAIHRDAFHSSTFHSSAFYPPNRGAISEYRRSGFTLIELVLVLSMVSSLLGGTIGLLALVQKSNQQGQQNLLHRQELRRFADDVRRDMHLSNTAEAKDTELVMTSESPKSEIVYRVEKGSLVRRKTSSTDKSAESQDRYGIGSDANIAIEWLEEGTQVQWTITSDDRPKNPVRIIASRRPSR